MLLIKITGLVILFFNAAGLVFLCCLGGRYLWYNLIKKQDLPVDPLVKPVRKKTKPSIINDDIILDEDDLLKDMDLSDLDNLNLDDFD